MKQLGPKNKAVKVFDPTFDPTCRGQRSNFEKKNNHKSHLGLSFRSGKSDLDENSHGHET